MPFLDDTGPKPELERNIFWRSIALIGDQLERMVLLNIIWASQTLPALFAWALPGLPAWLKQVFILYTTVMLIPVTGLLFAMLVETSVGTPLSIDLVKEVAQKTLRNSFLKLLPLLSLFYWLWAAASMAEGAGIFILDAFARFLMLILAMLSLYWGSIIADRPDLGAIQIFIKSCQLFWKKPGATLLAGILCILALLLGIVSIGGFFLIVPVLIVLIQVQLYQMIQGKI